MTQIGLLFTELGPAGSTLVGFVGLLSSVVGFYGATVLHCRLRGGDDCNCG